MTLLLACKRNENAPGPDAAQSAAAEATVKVPAEPAPTVMPREQVLAVVNPEGLPAYSGKTGILEGRITVEGDAPPDLPNVDFSSCEKARAVHGKLFREQALGNGKRALLDAIVGVTGYQGAYIPARTDVETVEIKNCSFTRRTIVITLGQRLDILNREPPSKDSFFAPDLKLSPAKVLRMAAPGGDAVHLFPKVVTRDALVDKMNHKYMSADVYVATHPLNAVSGEGGSYRIEGIPVGRVNVNAFHPAFNGASKRVDAAGAAGFADSVEIAADKVTTHNVVLTYAAK
jgi:hypothetical protein